MSWSPLRAQCSLCSQHPGEYTRVPARGPYMTGKQQKRTASFLALFPFFFFQREEFCFQLTIDLNCFDSLQLASGEDPLRDWVKRRARDPIMPTYEMYFSKDSYTSQVRSCPCENTIILCNTIFQHCLRELSNIPNKNYHPYLPSHMICIPSYSFLFLWVKKNLSKSNNVLLRQPAS